jgi:predicted DNA-binding protein
MKVQSYRGGNRVMGERRNFYLSDLQLKRLNTMSKKLGLSASEILRRAIDEYWERFERKAKGK